MARQHFSIKWMLVGCVLFTPFIEATTRVVNSTSNDLNTVGTLSYWLLNADDGDVIDCNGIAGQSLTLTTSLPAITKSYVINGAGIVIDGASLFQAFQVASGEVVINNVTIQNAVSKGGNGGDGYSGGGGAVGGGGALYIHGGTSVTLTASSLINNVAQGGDGGDASNIGNAGGGGGGGFGGGDGGDAVNLVSTGGGGGGHSNGGDGGSSSSTNGEDGVYYGGGGGGAGINSVVPGGNGGSASPDGTFVGGSQSNGNGGGGAGTSQDGFSATGSGGSGVPGNGGNGIGDDNLFGAGGGGGASSETGFPGGNGVGAAGGGGGSNYTGGNGGILGGGGAGGVGGTGGEGGFGAGGGGAVTGGEGGGGFGAGGGNGGSDPVGVAGGGGGSGLGGAIFIQRGASLTIIDAEEISGNTAIAGTGGSSTNSSDPGTIAAQNGRALGYDIFMREEGSITFNLSNTLTIATAIEGDQTTGPNTAGGLQKLGNGTLRLNGTNTYSGLTSVQGGTLNLNGSVIGSVNIGSAGKLSGNATVLGDITSSGRLAPGNSIGTISTTNLTLTTPNVVEIEVAANGDHDLIQASGTAQLDGTLEVIPLAGRFEDTQSYTILTATGGRTGSFTNVIGGHPSLIGVHYDPNRVIVEVLPINAIDLNSNAAHAASCYLANGFTTGSDIENVSAALLTLDFEEIKKGLNQIQPSQYSGLAWSQIENTLLIRSSYSQHLEDAHLSCGCHEPRVWIEAIGAWQKQNSSSHQFGYTDWTGGTTLGWDALSCNNFKLGVAASYTYSRLNWDKSVGHANTNSYYGGLYSNWTHGRGYLNAALIGAYSHYKTDRHIHFASIDRQASASHNSWEGLAGFEAGFNFDCSACSDLIPFVRVDYVHLSRQGFVEKGAQSLNLDIHRNQDQVVQSELGVIWTGDYLSTNTCASGTYVPRLKLSYINDAPVGHQRFHANFVDSDCEFSVRGFNWARNLGAASLGLTYRNSADTMSVTLRYDGQFGRNYTNQAANLSLEIKF